MKTQILFRLLIAFLLCGQPTMAAAGLEEDIQAHMAQGNYQAALDLINAGLKKDGTNRKLLLAKGFSLIKLNQLDDAAYYYTLLRKVFPDEPEPVNNLAMVYRLQKEYAKAITTFSETIRDFPDYTRAYGNLGDTYIEIAQTQYQRGFSVTGNVLLQQKALLSREFDQLANRAVTANTQQLEQRSTAPPPPPIVKAAPVVTPPPVKKVDPTVQYRQEIVEALTAWVDDWMSLDATRYLSHYSQQFVPEKNYSQEEWIGRKRNVFSRAGYIKVYLTDVEINFASDDINSASVKFKQLYASEIYNASSIKQLQLTKSPTGWLIIKETSKDS